jgi:iron complex outermembrane recepter protein
MQTFTRLIAFATLLLSYSGLAQNRKITGSIADNKGKIVEFATVTLLKVADSTLVKGAIADANGKFEIEQIADGSYLLGISQIGYRKFYSPVFNLNSATPSIDFSNLVLEELSNELKEVQVKAQKPFIEQQIDRTVVNVDNSIVAAGNTALEVLEKSPGVTVDQDGNISLKGKQAVLIYVDDKPTYMSAADLANLLRNMQANQLDKIEIMTTPPAKYDAAGNAGIINIKMKRNQNLGLNGSTNVTYGYGLDTHLPKYNGGVNLNYRQNKWNIYGNANASDRKGWREMDIRRSFSVNKQVVSGFNQIAVNDQHNNWMGLKLGADYFASKKTVIGVLLNANNGLWEQPNGTSTAQITKANGQLDSTSITKSIEKRNWANFSANANIKHSFDSTGRELTADFDFAHYDNRNTQVFRTNKYILDQTSTPVYVRNEDGKLNSGIYIYSAKLDMVKPISKTKKLEYGAKTSLVRSANDMTYWFLNKTETNPVVDPLRTRDFQYTENINAAYINYSAEFKPVNVQLGLRAENTNGQGVLLGKKLLNRNYTNVFPTAYFRKKLNAKNSLGFNLARRIDRPSYEDLNPFLFFLDPYTFNRGNEKLLPEFTNSAELSHTFKDAITTTLNYSITNGKMSEVLEQDNLLKTTNVTSYNISKMYNYGISVASPLPIKKWWNGNLYLNWYSSRYLGDLPRNTYGPNGQITSTEYQHLDVRAATLQANIQNQITLPKNWTLELSGWYRSPGIEGQLRMNAMGAANIGVRKKILAGKGNLNLNVNDVFWTQKFTGSFNFNDINVAVRNRWESRVARLTFNYRFGNAKVAAARNRQTGLEDEKNRVKSNQ